MLYPDNSRLLIGLSGSASSVSTMLPMLWYHLIVSTDLAFTHIMIIWAVITAISAIVCLFIGPWHNLKEFPNGETFSELKSQRKRLTKNNTEQTEVGFTGNIKIFVYLINCNE